MKKDLLRLIGWLILLFIGAIGHENDIRREIKSGEPLSDTLWFSDVDYKCEPTGRGE